MQFSYGKFDVESPLISSIKQPFSYILSNLGQLIYGNFLKLLFPKSKLCKFGSSQRLKFETSSKPTANNLRVYKEGYFKTGRNLHSGFKTKLYP